MMKILNPKLNVNNMKIIGFILAVIITVLLELPAILIYFRPTSDALDVLMILNISIISVLAQWVGRNVYELFK